MHLLDTNILNALYLGNSKIINALRHLDDPQVAITIVTKVELLRGRLDFLLKADKGDAILHAQDLLIQTEQRLSEIEVIHFDINAIAQLERLIANRSLRKSGRADLLIASIALANRATLVTRNLKDFQRIPNLRVINWFDFPG
ncbi:MAG: type II toxin-antitoxin system VapC family toxin [Oculatellaceae cyanobacterium Prado106]|jgi:tRNA(fMet)-specific endonuclease VapC|nr:type II toxin-antitoxin system VapC family toxin [Oculatellaceae cyanobacterium Prado106]